MHNIIIPQSNTNDTEVFIAEWKFKDNDLIKKGDHLFSIETSKVVEEIFSEHTGYLKIQSGKGSRAKVGEIVGFITKKKTDVKIGNKLNEKSTIFTKKAKELLSKNNIKDPKVGSEIGIRSFGNKLGTLAGPNTVSLSLIDCSTLSIDGFSSTNPNCVGSADGTINVNNVSNGSGNFSFNWSNGSTQPNITSLIAGTYVLSVTDNNSGCSTTDSVTLVDPSPLSGTLTGTNISCNGLSDGTLLAIASVFAFPKHAKVGSSPAIPTIAEIKI